MRRGGTSVLVAAVFAVAVVGIGALIVDRTTGRFDPGGPRTETVVVQAPRGRILDRSGKVLVEDGTAVEVRADVGAVAALGSQARSELLDALATVLGTAAADVLVDALAAGDDEVVLATRVADEARQTIDADPARFPGITLAVRAGRHYRYGTLLAHVLGYLGRITEQEYEEKADGALTPDSIVGKAGIERAMDRELRGVPGQVVYELDDAGRRVRELIDRREEPERGADVYLTIDINLQYLVERGLVAEVERRRGVQDNGCFVSGCDPTGAASVAVDPRNGQVLAAASFPTYDPTLFAGGISTEDYEALEDQAADSPLLNRAVGGQYAPGATIMPFTAHAGLAAGLITPADPYDDTGVYRYSADCQIEEEDNNCSATNAGRTAHGEIDLADALRVSSETYFYALGDRSWRARSQLGEEVIQDGVAGWGFGAETGIEVIGETNGRVPTPDWLMEHSEQLNGDTELGREAGTWTAVVSGNTLVGQGDLTATPLQLANAYATLANGGTIWRPHLVLQTTAFAADDEVEVIEPERTGEVDLPAEWRDPIVAGLDGVTKGPGGTASTAFAGFDQSACPIAGKTGTARVTGKNDTSLFAGFAPTPAPGRESTIAMATVFQEAGFGASAAVPLTRRVLEPFAAVGCDIDAFGAAGSPYEAPLGGAIDVAAAIAEYIPPIAVTDG